MALQYKELSIDHETIACEYDICEKNVVVVHGAGTSGRDRYYEFARVIQDRGLGVILFDFSGHGDSSGSIKQSSLNKRLNQATQVIEALLPTDSIFYLIGFSMGAQTTCDLLGKYGNRIPAVLLGCPGVYDKRARDLQFEDSKFTNILRTEKSWNNSDAFNVIQLYLGKIIVATGSKDSVIPNDAVDRLILKAVNGVARKYTDADHQLAKWLSHNPAELNALIDDLLSADSIKSK